jgi:general secretion pathway protein B
MSNIVAIENVKPGMVIVQILKQNGPVKIRKSGLVTSDAMVQGLSEMGVQEVEIDPDQTVEIAPAVHHRTQTQALLRGEHDTTAKFDKSLNEQFNRSLFLPTVEGLPSAWKLYTKQATLFAVVIIVGLGIGFCAATIERWWPIVTSHTAKLESSPAAETKNSTTDNENNEGTPSLHAAQNKEELKQASVKGVSESDTTSQTTQGNVGQNNSQGDSAGSQPISPSGTSGSVGQTGGASSQADGLNAEVQQPLASLEAQSESESERGSVDANGKEAAQSQPALGGDTAQEYEGKVLNEDTSNSDVSVSPELMARFNAAVEALDTKAQDNERPDENVLTVKDDIPRVDQLPVRLLTRLPTMNFSAHMYASRTADRWVRVNGRQLGEGDWIADKVQIINIEAQRVVLSFEDELFTMAALTDW